MLPDQAEIQYLDYAKKIAMYGMHMHAAKVLFSLIGRQNDMFIVYLKSNYLNHLTSSSLFMLFVTFLA